MLYNFGYCHERTVFKNSGIIIIMSNAGISRSQCFVTPVMMGVPLRN